LPAAARRSCAECAQDRVGESLGVARRELFAEDHAAQVEGTSDKVAAAGLRRTAVFTTNSPQTVIEAIAA
jgi:hypothetical protein